MSLWPFPKFSYDVIWVSSLMMGVSAIAIVLIFFLISNYVKREKLK